jgi:outer membrane receptor protein involved in Fe transport
MSRMRHDGLETTGEGMRGRPLRDENLSRAEAGPGDCEKLVRSVLSTIRPTTKLPNRQGISMTTVHRLTIRGAVATALLAATATAVAAEPTTLEEIVVTAQKRTERLIDVPASITAVQSEDLTKENLVSIADFYARVPGLQFSAFRTYGLSIRGITTGGASNPTLALLIDDVQFGATVQGGLGNSRFPDIDPSTLERIEVLRGPQGTLYGAASLGGLLKYVTKQPDTSKFSARVEAGASTVQTGGSGWNTRGSINLPLWSEKVALSVSAFEREDPAYIDNLNAVTGTVAKDVNTAKTYGGRAALLVKPFDGLAITLSALRQKRDAKYGTGIQSLPTTTGAVPNYQPRFGRNVISTAAAGDTGDQEQYTGRIEWDLGPIQVTSITAYGKSEGINVTDVSRVFTFIPPSYGYGTASTAAVTILDVAGSTKKTQELRLAGKIANVDLRGGAMYTKEQNRIDQTLLLYAPDGAFRDTPYNGKGPSSYEEKAAFADGVWHISEQWDVQAGVRYAKNEQTSGGGLTITTPQVTRFFGPTSTSALLRSSDNSFTFAVSPTYKFNPDLMAYARVASGYRPGGPNGVSTLPTVPKEYGADTVLNYELGLKGYVLDRKVSFDAAVFQIDWTDIQLQNTDSASNFTYRTNGGEARSRGLELSGDYRPFAGTTITANATILDAEITESLPRLTGADSLVGTPGARLPASAKFSGYLAIDQAFPLSSWLEGYVGASATYVGGRMSEFVNSNAVTVRNAQRFEFPSYTQIDLRAGVTTDNGLRLDLYARNVGDKQGVITANNRNGTSTSTVNFLQPRTIGVTLSKSF